MKIKILGCHGSDLPDSNLCSFLINDSFVMDAGSITSSLPYPDQKKIENILITHPHLDHIKDIAFLADNRQIEKGSQINLISSREVLDVIKKHFLNGKIWPDFTKLPEGAPVLKYYPIPLKSAVQVGGLEIKALKVTHSVPAVAFIISDRESSVLFTGDMSQSDRLWDTANKIKNLKAIFIDTAFPNRIERIAQKSKHLTPKDLKKEIKKIKSPAAIYSYHLKTFFEEEIKDEIRKCCPNVKTLQDGEVLTF